MIENLKEKRIGVLMGGLSAERSVSLKSGAAIANALMIKGYKVTEIDITPETMSYLLLGDIDVAFIGLHGRFGEDGTMQGLLELLRIPYTGSSHTASAIAINKLLTKEVLAFNKIPITPFEVIGAGGESSITMSLPLVVKPIHEGSSIGVSIVKEQKDLKAALDLAFAYDDEILVEKYIKARELQVGMLCGKPLGVIEIIPKKDFYDYEAKYTDKMAEHIFPAKVSKEMYDKLMNVGVNTYRALGLSGAARIDILLGGDNEIYVLEANTLPGMTAISLLPEIAGGVGISFPALCEEILKDAKLHVKTTGK